ncbi:SDR family NAD(P)-dependent oxidoreductase [Pollutimonas thiosulfatoxidans]|uniref:3-hydroxyacyl-CoA dehydrogenase n=1 Tax=Pollutimonas thiosulfatoxidans TaxID=2028345 RepID=A0A410G8R2_9BURK|nr:SDR family NAD(P)-dependent oxidoreductase [Pollutimonas thiosulfatoxidans]QAA92677.1 3-hydroxyacyl-CoA dehydrogenase [Pollutimonas thiosulfatoxidans]
MLNSTEKPLVGKVAIVTGAGGGLGRAHVLELARLGASVVVNDLGSGADDVAAQARAAGAQALAVMGDVSHPEDMQRMAAQAIQAFGRIDILVNNAGVLRDRSFAKMSLDDWRLVLDVHLMGAVHATRAVWPHMQDQAYGRIIMTTSSSGLYGNFGQSNYAAAKMALVGLMQTLKEEGGKYNIRVNCLAPTAVTGMTEGLLDEEAATVLSAERVSKGLLALVQDQAPTGMILLAGGGSFSCAHITMTQGIYLPDDHDPAVSLCSRLAQVQDQTLQLTPRNGWDQSKHELAKALTPRV